MSWYEKAFPDRPTDMPPTLELKVCKEYEIKFKEKSPRVVRGGYLRATPVINVEVDGNPYSLYLSHVDLARRISLVEKKLKESGRSLKHAKLKIHNMGKKSKRNYFYEVELLE